MLKKTACIILTFIILILPLTALAEISAEDQELYDYYAAQLDKRDRIEGEIVVTFEDGTSVDEKFQVLYDTCAEAYGTDDKDFIASKIDFRDWANTQGITVPDEIIVETMVALSKNPVISSVWFNFRIYLPDDPRANPDFLLGDVNEDGEITARDYILVKQFYFGVTKPDFRQTVYADMNENGVIDARDYILLKRMWFGVNE